MRYSSIGAAVLLAHASASAADSKLMPCADTQIVSYEEHFQRIEEYISLTPAPQIKPVPDAERGAWTWSPHQTSAYKFRRLPDFSIDGPWTSVVEVSGTTAHPVKLLVTFPEHGNTAPRLTWLNENWLFVHTWLGRMVDASLIIDVDQKKIIHEEQGSLHLLFEPCE